MGLALVAALGLASCSSDEPAGVATDKGKITITSLGFTQSRSTNQNLQSVQIAQGVQVGVFVTDGTAFVENGDNNLLVADGAGQFVSTTDMYWPAGKSASIYAYAPYNSEWTNGLSEAKSFTVQRDQSTDDAYLASDLLYGTPASNPVAATESAVPVKFAHKLAKIKVNIKSDNPEELRGATLSLVNVCNTVTIDLSTGELGTATGSAEITAANYASDATEFGCAAVIAPQTLASATPFINIVKADGSAVTCKLSAPMTLASGKVYTFTVTLGEVTKVEADSELDDWEEGDNSNVNGEETVTYGVGDYVLTNGTIIKKSEASNYEESQIAGVIFSTTVSETDAAAGYKGYILGKTTQGNVKWAADNSLGYGEEYTGLTPRNVHGASEDLDGRTETAFLKSLAGFNADNFPWSTQLASIEDVPGCSEWFVPSMGQWIQILNNLGKANINTDATTAYWASFPNATAEEIAQEISGYTAVKGITRTDVVANINSALGKDVLTTTRVYASSTEYGNNRNNVWYAGLIEVNNNTFPVADKTESWFILNGSKNQGRGWVYVAAYK